MTVAAQVRADVERNRSAIVAAAIALLGQSPNASMQQIAQAAGVNRATLYRHFTNREQLFTALHEAVLADTAALSSQLPTEGPVVPALRAYLDDAITIGERYRFILMYRRTDPGLFEAEAKATAPVVRAIRRAQQQGEIDGRLDPVFASGQLAMLVIGAVGLVERGAMTLDDARVQAQVALGNAIVPR
ncbi:TetR/AcrR family transcriptional regulator [Gordonia hankookensis]|uniref:TetR/AcrR family transcriptional regulator n=1 Tax=Gordonia hankookensis TaxID=589403 RepID=UPI002954EF08|nr:TetR/AcrR family transcriptional regulator [Gordonia hankookensis]